MPRGPFIRKKKLWLMKPERGRDFIMLCEKCKMREASVRITKISDGSVEEHHFCEECAGAFRQGGDVKAAEWSKAIFKLLTEAVIQRMGEKNNTEENERLKKIACPSCGKTYGDFLNDYTFGCPDCYDAFGPSLQQTILSLQGADTHVGKRPSSGRKKKEEKPVPEELTREEEISMLREKMEEAVRNEDYEAAARFRDALREKEGSVK